MVTMLASRHSNTEPRSYFESPVRESIPAIQSGWSQADRAQRAALGRVQRAKLLRLMGVPSCMADA